jgi:hypothetical protein
VYMTQEDSEVAVLLRRPVGALPSRDEDDAVCFFGRQSPLSVAQVWSSGTLQLHGEGHDGREYMERFACFRMLSLLSKLVTWGDIYSGPERSTPN